MNVKQRAICQRLVDHYGTRPQEDQAIEECAELITALRHYRRGKCDKAAVVDEIADVAVMVEQLAGIFGRAAVETRIDEKLERAMARANGHKDCETAAQRVRWEAD